MKSRLTNSEKDVCLVQLGQEIDLGIEQIENGQYTKYSAHELPNLIESIITEGRKRRMADNEKMFDKK